MSVLIYGIFFLKNSTTTYCIGSRNLSNSWQSHLFMLTCSEKKKFSVK